MKEMEEAGQILRGKYEQGTVIYVHENIIVKSAILYTKIHKKLSNYFLNMRIFHIFPHCTFSLNSQKLISSLKRLFCRGLWMLQANVRHVYWPAGLESMLSP